MLKLRFCFLLTFCSLLANAKTYYIATDGRDTNSGTRQAPFASLGRAQALVGQGDTVYIRGGVYKIQEEQIMKTDQAYARVFDMARSGSSAKRICYWGYPGERPVFDLSNVRPSGKRVSVFFVSGSWLHFRNFEIIGTQVTIRGHTQSECLSNRGGSNNIYENLSMHDGMGIGFYLTAGADNLVLNCDAYNNYDNYSEGIKGGNVDGFGAHPVDPGSKGNVFRFCRAWYNSDDGFDLINAQAPVTIEYCWSFLNGYQPGSLAVAGDGTGFKAGGYGMKDNPRAPDVVPRHIVRFCVAYYNKNKGFYANHHLGGIDWIGNSAFKNPVNFCMLNRASAKVIRDVPGYDHLLAGNISFEPRNDGKDIADIDWKRCELKNNTFPEKTHLLKAADFQSLDPSELLKARDPQGVLSALTFMSVRRH